MALRVLSGVVATSNWHEGNFTVNLTRHEVTGDVRITRRQSVGPDGVFNGTPGYIAVPREFKIIESPDFKDHPGDEDHGLFDRVDDPVETDLFEVNSTVTEDTLNIRWRTLATGDPKQATRSQLREISYMVVGEV